MKFCNEKTHTVLSLLLLACALYQMFGVGEPVLGLLILVLATLEQGKKDG